MFNIRNFSFLCSLFLAIFLAGCEQNVVEEIDYTPPKENEYKQPTAIKKALENAWYEKINITLTKEVPIAQMLKGIAQRLDLKLVLNIKDTEGINYCAKNKPFIEVLADICEANEWKLLIKGRNAKISKDSAYMHSYSIPYLIGERKGVADTSFSGSGNIDGSSSNSVNIGSNAKLSNTATLDAFDELRKSIEMIAQSEAENTVKFSIHKQGGILNVIATQKVHRMIMKYINLLSRQMRNQILIEARIYEIELFENFETGVDWSKLINFSFGTAQAPITTEALQGGIGFGLIKNVTDNMDKFEGNILTFLRRFGKVHSMSNPRVMIANNNFAIFKIVDNKVFFRLTQHNTFDENQQNRRGNNNQQTTRISSEIHTIPVGVILLVQPSIDEHGKITISLHPTISEVHDEVDDPAIILMANNANRRAPTSKIPVIKTRELDTVFTTEENKISIIGGLLYSKKRETESGLPFEWLSGSKKKLSEKKEIVIAIKAKIVYCEQNADEAVFLE